MNSAWHISARAKSGACADAAQKAADEQKAAEEAAAKAKLDDKDAAVQRELRAQGTKLLEERERLQATLAGPTFQRMFEEARHKGYGRRVHVTRHPR